MLERPRLGRRSAVVALVLAAAATLAGWVWLRRTRAPPRPDSRANFVVVLTDDQDLLLGSLDHMPRTRHWLRDGGTAFERYFVTQALCCPARATLLTGLYVHNHQVITTSPPLGGFVRFHARGLEERTIAVALHAAGYRTALVGKYFNGYARGQARTYVPPGWSDWRGSLTLRKAYSQFGYTLNVDGRLETHGDAPADYFTDVVAAAGVAFLEARADDGKPFLLYLAPTAPHPPFVPAPRHAAELGGLRVPRGVAFDEADLTDKPPFLQRPPLTEAQIAGLDHAYRQRARMLLAVDEMVDALFATLARRGLLERTYVFFTSDNGFHLGQHRLLAGKNTMYEEDVHVPLLVRGPGVAAGATVTALAANTDLAPTLAELAGTRMPAELDGRSLVPFLRGAPPAAWRNAVLLEHPPLSAPPEAEGEGEVRPGEEQGDAPARGFRGLRLADEVYVEHVDGACEDYDLAADPSELDNRCATLPPARRADLSRWLGALATCAGETCRALDAAPPR